MINKYPDLFKPGYIGSLKIKNRIVMAPLDTKFRTENGALNEQHKYYLGARAKGGVGLIIMDNVTVEYPRGSVGVYPARIDQDRFIPALNETVEEVHFWGAHIIAQLCHAGRQTLLAATQGKPLVSASAISYEGSGTIPVELSISEISDFIKLFTEGARRAKIAGFDGVEVHAAHGYLLSSFLSPALNRRSDDYGGSTKNRAKIVVQIIRSIKKCLGNDFIVVVRFNCRDGIPEGLMPSEAVKLGLIFEEAGADALNISAGTYEAPAWTFPPMMRPEGVLIPDIVPIKNAVKIPVMGVGKIMSPFFANEIVADKKVDFVVLGRALLADPEWPNKAEKGEEKNIRPCIACNEGCIHRISNHLSVGCSVNPEVGKEKDLLIPNKKNKSRKIIVVGAGPAGLEFALRAHEKGHEVLLFDSSAKIGGQLNYAQIIDFKKDIKKLIEFYEYKLIDRKIKLQLNKTITLDVINEIKPDDIILATGAKPLIPFDFIDKEKFLTFKEVLEGVPNLKKSVVIIGGGSKGCDLAVHLASKGIKIKLIELTDKLAISEDESIIQFYNEKFDYYGIEVFTKTLVSNTQSNKFIAKNLNSYTEWEIPFNDNLIIAIGMVPNRDLYEQLNKNLNNNFRVFSIGDCFKVATIFEAVNRAYYLVERVF